MQVIRCSGRVAGVTHSTDHLAGVDVLTDLEVLEAAGFQVGVVVEPSVVALDPNHVAAERVMEALDHGAPTDRVDRGALRGKDVYSVVFFVHGIGRP